MIKPLSILLTILLGLGGCMPQQAKVSWPGPDSEQLLYWCIPADGADGIWPVDINLPKECPKQDVSRGQWDHFPIIVNAEEPLALETMEAVEAFNTALGFKLFSYESTNMDPDIAVIVAGDHFWAAAEAKRMTWEGKHYGVVNVYNGLELKDRADVILHELGHEVGLRHDQDNRLSVMFPSAASRVAYFESIDLQVLRRLYLGHP